MIVCSEYTSRLLNNQLPHRIDDCSSDHAMLYVNENLREYYHESSLQVTTKTSLQKCQRVVMKPGRDADAGECWRRKSCASQLAGC